MPRRSELGVQWQANVMHLWWWALPLCVVRPVFWNFNLSFKATSRPTLLLLSVVADTLLLSLLALVLIPVLGARGLLVALILSSTSTVLLQWSWFTESRVPGHSGRGAFADGTGR